MNCLISKSQLLEPSSSMSFALKLFLLRKSLLFFPVHFSADFFSSKQIAIFNFDLVRICNIAWKVRRKKERRKLNHWKQAFEKRRSEKKEEQIRTTQVQQRQLSLSLYLSDWGIRDFYISAAQSKGNGKHTERRWQGL